MNRVTIWGMAAGVSLAVHAALFLLLPLSLVPEPVRDQPIPTGQLDVQAYRVERSQAQQAEPDMQVAAQSPIGAVSLGQGAIPLSHTKGERPAAQPLPASPPAAEPLPPAKPVTTDIRILPAPAAPLSPGVPDAALLLAMAPPRVSVPASASPATALPVQSPPQAVLLLQPPQAVTLAPAPATGAVIALQTAAPMRLPSAPPTVVPALAVASRNKPIAQINAAAGAMVLPVVFTTPAPVPDVDPAVQVVAASENRAAAVKDLPLPEQKATAALAFSSGMIGDVDPLSLIAIQSFMRAGDLSASASAAGRMRDGISAILARVPCARLQVNFIAETGILMLNGHVPENGLRAPVLAALQAQVGDTIIVTDNILILKRPMCAALSGIAASGLPSSTEQITNPKVIGENTQAIVSEFKDGERLTLDFTAPDYDAYVYVDYFDSTGQVIHLSPNRFSQQVFHDARDRISFGSEKCGRPSINIRMGPPYGQELGISFATSVRLYDGVRPIVEPAQPYVEWIKTRLAAARNASDDFKGEWFYFIINSSAEKYQPGPDADTGAEIESC